MSAVELLKEVRALPTRERKKLLRALLRLEGKPPKPPGNDKLVRWPDVEARAKLIFGDRVFPNLVLLEREESAF